MAKTAFKGAPVTLAGEFVKAGTSAPEFYIGKRRLEQLYIKRRERQISDSEHFPQYGYRRVRYFRTQVQPAGCKPANTVVLAISKDLPFAQGRFCTTEGITNVIPLSDYRYTSDFAENMVY